MNAIAIACLLIGVEPEIFHPVAVDGDTIAMTFELEQFDVLTGVPVPKSIRRPAWVRLNVHLDGIAAPEADHPDVRVREWSRRAAIHVDRRITAAKSVTVVGLAEDLKRSDGRLTARVIVDGTDLGAELVAIGMARPATPDSANEWNVVDVGGHVKGVGPLPAPMAKP